jgi:hypothetical protein
MTAALAPVAATGDTTSNVVQLPGVPVDATGDDLAAPIVGLLRQLNMLETPTDVAEGVGPIKGTPQSLQVITAGVLTTTKLIGGITGVGGLGATIATAWGGLQAQELPWKIALIAAAAVLLSATIVALAIIIQSDVAGRSAATVAQYEGRAAVATSMLNASSTTTCCTSGKAGNAPAKRPALDENGRRAMLIAIAAERTEVRFVDGTSFVEVNGVRRLDEGLQVRRIDGDWVSIERVAEFQPVESRTRVAS